MTQLDDIVGLFASVDEILALPGNATQESVGEVLPAYRDTAPGWYAEFESWLNQRDSASGRRVPSIGEALQGLASGDAPTGTLATRRLLGIAALTRADADLYAPGGDEAAAVRAALAPLVPADGPAQSSDSTDRRIGELHELLAGGDGLGRLFPSIDRWDSFVRTAKELRLVAEDLVPVPPCSATAVIDPGEGAEPIMSLRTDFVAPGYSIDRVKHFLDPANWPGCTDLWISMDQLAPPEANRYLEVIGAGDAPLEWRLTTALDFARRERPDEVAVDYWLSADQSLGDRWVNVDEGSIVVRQISTGVKVSTVKRLRFRDLPLGEGFAVLLCALGWASAGQDMVFRSARGGGPPTKPWPGGLKQDPDDKARRRTTERTIAAVNDLAEITGVALVACAHAYGRSLRVAQAGHYGIEDMVADVTDSFIRAADDVTRVATVGIRATFGPTTPLVPGSGSGTGPLGTPGGSATRTVVSDPYDDPRTVADETLVLRGPMERGTDAPIAATIVLDATSTPPSFTLSCEAPLSACGMYWGEVEVFVRGTPAHPARVIPVSLLIP